MAFIARLSTTYTFEAAHLLKTFPAGHPNTRIHGHSYCGEVSVEGPVAADTGFVMDHTVLEAAVRDVTAQLDHRLLNEIVGLELPTGENIARWIWDRLSPDVPHLKEITVKRPTCGITVTYSGRGSL